MRHIMMTCTALATIFSACGEDTGSLNVTTFGEDFIELGIPVATGPDVEGVVDGFEVRYDTFMVVLSDLEVADRNGSVGHRDEDARVFDMTLTGPHPVTTVESLEAQRWDQIGLALRPATSVVPMNVDTEDANFMRDRGYSSYVEGEATRGSESYRFAWGFTTATAYDECEDADQDLGVVVPTGGTASMEITIHGDHFLYDDLQDDDADLRFQAIADADANQDGEVTLEELDAVNLDTLPSDLYGTGGDGSVNTLRDYLEAQSRTLIHFQGEGDCRQTRL